MSIIPLSCHEFLIACIWMKFCFDTLLVNLPKKKFTFTRNKTFLLQEIYATTWFLEETSLILEQKKVKFSSKKLSSEAMVNLFELFLNDFIFQYKEDPMSLFWNVQQQYLCLLLVKLSRSRHWSRGYHRLVLSKRIIRWGCIIHLFRWVHCFRL